MLLWDLGLLNCLTPLWRRLLGGLWRRCTASRLILVGTVLVRLILVGLVAVHVRLVLIRLVADGFVGMRRLSWIRMRLRRCALLRRSLIVSLHGRGRLDVVICRERLADGEAGRAAMVCAGKLGAIGAGDLLILHLRPHGRGMGLVACRQFRRSSAYL